MKLKSKLIIFLFTISSVFCYSQQINYGSNNGKFLTINGTKVYYEEYGKGFPILLLHGGLGDISNFSIIIPELSKKYRVIIPDAPGLGRSEYANEILSYEMFADYNSKFIDQLNLKELFVIGWSDGANTALILTKNRPEKIKKLIISGANYKLSGFTKGALEDCKNLSDTAFVSKELKGWINHYQKLSKKDWKRYISEVGQMWFKDEYFPKSDLEKIQIPTLVIYGDRDIYSLEHGIEIKNAISKSQFCVIPNCSHNVFCEKPKLFNELAITFFDEK
ncbi:MAG TPA: alpha/beta hydrolase [Paludibacteraceae bacterium]|nr:alpha/beta hydrolase [Paludibacteraceae bacterium]